MATLSSGKKEDSLDSRRDLFPRIVSALLDNGAPGTRPRKSGVVAALWNRLLDHVALELACKGSPSWVAAKLAELDPRRELFRRLVKDARLCGDPSTHCAAVAASRALFIWATAPEDLMGSPTPSNLIAVLAVLQSNVLAASSWHRSVSLQAQEYAVRRVRAIALITLSQHWSGLFHPVQASGAFAAAVRAVATIAAQNLPWVWSTSSSSSSSSFSVFSSAAPGPDASVAERATNTLHELVQMYPDAMRRESKVWAPPYLRALLHRCDGDPCRDPEEDEGAGPSALLRRCDFARGDRSGKRFRLATILPFLEFVTGEGFGGGLGVIDVGYADSGPRATSSSPHRDELEQWRDELEAELIGTGKGKSSISLAQYFEKVKEKGKGKEERKGEGKGKGGSTPSRVGNLGGDVRMITALRIFSVCVVVMGKRCFFRRDGMKQDKLLGSLGKFMKKAVNTSASSVISRVYSVCKRWACCYRDVVAFPATPSARRVSTTKDHETEIDKESCRKFLLKPFAWSPSRTYGPELHLRRLMGWADTVAGLHFRLVREGAKTEHYTLHLLTSQVLWASLSVAERDAGEKEEKKKKKRKKRKNHDWSQLLLAASAFVRRVVAGGPGSHDNPLLPLGVLLGPDVSASSSSSCLSSSSSSGPASSTYTPSKKEPKNWNQARQYLAYLIGAADAVESKSRLAAAAATAIAAADIGKLHNPILFHTVDENFTALTKVSHYSQAWAWDLESMTWCP